jgi:adenylate cyclase
MSMTFLATRSGPEAEAGDHPMLDTRAIDELIAWMVDGARPGGNPEDILARICERLVAAGVALDRFALFVNTLHPNIAGRRLLWEPDKGMSMIEGSIELFASADYLRSPLPLVSDRQLALRRRLTDGDLSEFDILGELRAEGFTDYLALPLVFTSGEAHVVTFASKARDGFPMEAVDALQLVQGPLARLVEAYLLRLNAASILSAYVGRNSGEHILNGRVHRGDGEEIDAVILFTDLIGFTEMSNKWSGREIVSLLNDAFDLVVPPVELHGGEILKFLGDGFFAIFPYTSANGPRAAIEAASRAVLAGERNLAESPLGNSVAFRSALHAGRFHYGNIGGATRLDFTAIGRPINYAARLLEAASTLELDRVASQDIADRLCVAPKLAATVAFKGFEGQQNIYAY